MKRCTILVAFAAIAAAGLPADLAVTVGSRHAALVVQDTRFDPAVQLASEVGAGVGGQWKLRGGRAGAIAAGLGLAVASVGPSTAFAGYFYRGLAVRSLTVTGAWTSPSGVGVRVGAAASFASYALTTLLFFYPEVEIAPTLRMRLAKRIRVDWALPVFYQFRQDLAYAVGIGLRATVALEFSSPES